jgi:DNA-binding transcriptional LysR family regulator
MLYSISNRRIAAEWGLVMEELDWRWLRSFVAVANAGGTQAGAKQSGLSQPTLSRHVAQLEQALGVTLFDRHGSAMTLSPHGSALLERALDVQASVKAFERQALGSSSDPEGSVRVTMTHMFGHNFAPRWLASLRKACPHITVELSLDDSEVNLLLREAEIAVRMFRPRQLDLIAQYCGQQQLGFFAARAYLKAHSTPHSIDALKEHELIGYDRITTWIDTARSMGFSYSRNDFSFRSDAEALHQEVAREGLGIAVLPIWIGKQSGLVRVLPSVHIDGQPVFLTAHPDLRRSARVSRVWDHLLQALPLVTEP